MNEPGSEWQVLVTTDVGDDDYDALVTEETFPTWEQAHQRLRELLCVEVSDAVPAVPVPGQNWYGEVDGDTYSLICTEWVEMNTGSAGSAGTNGGD